MSKIKLFLIRCADWFDAIVLQHQFYWLCQQIGSSSWWGEGDYVTGWVKQVDD
jgi:hypothetical protein